MNDLTDYSPAIRKLMADPAARKAALIQLSLDDDAATDLVAIMCHPPVGALALTVRMVAIFQAMVDEAELFDEEQLHLTLVDK